MATATPQASREAGVKALLDRWLDASRKGDLEAIMACYAPEVRAFDAIGPLQFTSAASYREHWKMCLGFMDGEMIFEAHDLKIETGGDIAFAHYLIRCGMVDESGQEQTGWMRGTLCARHVGGEWKIAHEHYSAPFDPETEKASTNLTP